MTEQPGNSCLGLIDGYELLRKQALAGGEGYAGLDLLRFRGLAAWLHIWKDHAPAVVHTQHVPLDFQPQKQIPYLEFPDQVRNEFITTLAGMVLNNHWKETCNV